MPTFQNTSFITFVPKWPDLDSPLTVQEAAERIQVTPRMLKYLINSGLLQATGRPGKRNCHIRESEVARYLSYWFTARTEPWPEDDETAF